MDEKSTDPFEQFVLAGKRGKQKEEEQDLPPAKPGFATDFENSRNIQPRPADEASAPASGQGNSSTETVGPGQAKVASSEPESPEVTDDRTRTPSFESDFLRNRHRDVDVIRRDREKEPGSS